MLNTPPETFTDTVSTTCTVRKQCRWLVTSSMLSISPAHNDTNFFEEATTTKSTTTSVATSTVPTAADFTSLASASEYLAERVPYENAAAPGIRGRLVRGRALLGSLAVLMSANMARSANCPGR